MEKLEVIQIRKRKPKEVARSHEPDKYDKAVEKAFWFVVGFSIALMICCIAFGQTYTRKECHSEAATSQALRKITNIIITNGGGYGNGQSI